MIKFLKFLWKKCFGSVGNSRTKIDYRFVKATKEEPSRDVALDETPPEPIQPESLHCGTHTRFKKSCPNCLTAVGVR